MKPWIYVAVILAALLAVWWIWEGRDYERDMAEDPGVIYLQDFQRAGLAQYATAPDDYYKTSE